MKVLGFGGPFFLHDPAAAILIDGKIVAAAEEERGDGRWRIKKAKALAATDATAMLNSGQSGDLALAF